MRIDYQTCTYHCKDEGEMCAVLCSVDPFGYSQPCYKPMVFQLPPSCSASDAAIWYAAIREVL